MISYHNGVMRLTCDECGEELKLSCFDFKDGIAQAKKRGWRTHKNSDGEWENYCENCPENN